MSAIRSIFIAFVALAVMGGCKKDVLTPGQVWQLDSHTTAKLNNVQFISDSICIAAGGVLYEQTMILRSTDGGYTWSADSTEASKKEMIGMDVGPDGSIYLCGVDGDVLYSIDSGKSWRFNRIITWKFYQDGAFSTPDTGIFIATTVQRQCDITRINAGFGIIDEKNYSFGLNKLYMTGPSTGYIIGYGAVMKTTDKGNTWAFQDVEGDNFTAMDIHSDQIWMCGSNGGIYHTTDGGAHWDRLRNGNNLAQPRYWLRSILFKDQNNGWAVGDEGKVIYTNDGGWHWLEYKTFTKNNLRSMALCPNGDLLIVGDGGSVFRVRP
jgi:photosystem II stability/assembly factor-like uncharacterized protein